MNAKDRLLTEEEALELVQVIKARCGQESLTAGLVANLLAEMNAQAKGKEGWHETGA